MMHVIHLVYALVLHYLLLCVVVHLHYIVILIWYWLIDHIHLLLILDIVKDLLLLSNNIDLRLAYILPVSWLVRL